MMAFLWLRPYGGAARPASFVYSARAVQNHYSGMAETRSGNGAPAMAGPPFCSGGNQKKYVKYMKSTADKETGMKRLLMGAVLALAGALGILSTATAEEGVTKDTIRIGMFGPMTGPYAVGSLQLLGAAAIYKSINDAGGINGRKLELFIEDDACDPNKTIAATKKLISQDHVFMIHGGWCSATVMAIKPELARHPGLPFVNLGAASAAIVVPPQPNIYQPVITTNTVAEKMVDFALSKPGAKRIAIISHSDEWAKSHLQPILARLKAKGIEPVETQYLEHGAISATSQVLKIREAKPDVVLAVMYPPELTIYLRDAYKYGVRVPTVTTQAASIEDMVKRVGSAAATKELYVFYPLSQTLSDPAFKKWEDIYRKYYPKAPVETFSFMAMTGALAIADAIKKAGPDLTRPKLIAELDKLHDFNSGLQEPLSFTPTDHVGIKTGKIIYWPNWPSGQPKVVTSYPAQ
jgi:branched-chain amino acid transport system substrate-binding protein